MATAGDVIERALKRILVQADEAPLEPSEYADAMDSLNDMMFGLEAEGVRLGYTEVTNVADEVTVPKGATRGVIANLAIECSADYGGTISQGLVNQAKRGMAAMRRLGQNLMQTTYPQTLPIGSGGVDTSIRTSPYYASQDSALVSLAGNSRTTTISTADTPVRVVGFWAVVRQRGLMGDINGTITSKVRAALDSDVRLSVTATGSGAYTFRVMQNGVSQASTTTTLSATPVTATLSTLVTLQPNDNLEVWVEADGHTTDLVVTDAQFEVQ